MSELKLRPPKRERYTPKKEQTQQKTGRGVRSSEPTLGKRREGWGTLKFGCGVALEGKPKKKRDPSLRSE
jgi:hypothetical protein